ncbi:MAG: saccharopine dehydrogenase C-terminal domain-containing protein [Bacteroidales bacterium]|nr:saccharopine dehydrogenase C-terminal domain-containing protein [Bacteroidales bacterium]
MKHILILGAGLSATSLINYLLENSQEHDWFVTLGDLNLQAAEKKLHSHPRSRAIQFDVTNSMDVKTAIENMDLVISLLPARFHDLVAAECLNQGVSMATASYVSPAIASMHDKLVEKGLVFLNELGVDPGIDHMSAMSVIDRIRMKKGKLTAFFSFTGGLVAPESDNNPWHYKFTWNPRNVVLAGQGVSQFIRNGMYKYIPYHKLFDRVLEREVLDAGQFEVYPNRDSLKYRKVYGIEGIPTIFRGTMRRPGFCEAWNVFVQLGCTDDTYVIENSEKITYREFINSFLRYDREKPVELKLADYLGIDPDGEIMRKLIWLGVFSNELIGLKNATPAQILQQLLEKKWSLDPGDKDMIVMQHEFEYELNKKSHKITSSMVFIGKNTVDTAMSVTVGTPLAIASKLLLTGRIAAKGVVVPTTPELYVPILEELESFGIHFVEMEEVLG